MAGQQISFDEYLKPKLVLGERWYVGLGASLHVLARSTRRSESAERRLQYGKIGAALESGSMNPNVYIIAGPNGAGKTTFAREFLPNYADCKNFINADLIAQGVSPFAAEAVIAFEKGTGPRIMNREVYDSLIARYGKP